MCKVRDVPANLPDRIRENPMKTINLFIDDRDVTVPADTTILEAAASVNVSVPTMCHLNGYDRLTSCMVCVVHDLKTDAYLPACSARVEEGMHIETRSEGVREARKDALDFLLSEHVGDCMAPCLRACPAHMNIPLMIRHIRASQFHEALVTVKNDIALPAVLGRICPAPCEKACHRGSADDDPVSICLLKRYVADVDLASETPWRPPVNAPSGKSVAVVGAGPTGLAAAYYLLRQGHECHVYDQHQRPGGALRYGISKDILPESVVASEVERIAELGGQFRMGQRLGQNLDWKGLRNDYDAIVLAGGKMDTGSLSDTSISVSERGIVIERRTYMTSVLGVFAGGNAVAVGRVAVRAVGHGKEIALSVGRFLEKGKASVAPRRFDSLLGKLRDEEAKEYAKEAQNRGRVSPEGGSSAGYSHKEALLESSRCFGCDCRKQESCRLRLYADEYKADQRRFTFVEKRHVQKNIQHDRVVFEPGKCIKCGLCVQITDKAGETLGLTSVGRGFDVRVEPPFGEPLSQALLKVAGDCVEACPTGALAWKERT